MGHSLDELQEKIYINSKEKPMKIRSTVPDMKEFFGIHYLETLSDNDKTVWRNLGKSVGRVQLGWFVLFQPNLGEGFKNQNIHSFHPYIEDVLNLIYNNDGCIIYNDAPIEETHSQYPLFLSLQYHAISEEKPLVLSGVVKSAPENYMANFHKPRMSELKKSRKAEVFEDLRQGE